MTFTGEAMSWRQRDEALVVELHRAPCNEIGTTALAELERLVVLLRERPFRALVLYSSLDSGFCAGADLRELHQGLLDGEKSLSGRAARAIGAQDRLVAWRVRRFLDRIHRVFDALDTAPITTVAVVHGVVFGGGFELALTADLIVAEKSARFAFPELRLGLVPGFGGIPRLNRDVGNALVRDLLLTGRSIGASRAHELGLVSQVVNRGEGLESAFRLAEQASRFDAHTSATAKAFLKRLPADELRAEKDTFCRLVTSPVVRKALDRFVTSEDRRPYLP